jgi:hypothetical protein
MSALDALLPDTQRKPWGWVALVLDVILPGLGSVIAGFKAHHATTWIVGLVLLVAFVGFFAINIVAVSGVAWLLSIAHGILIWMRSA